MSVALRFGDTEYGVLNHMNTEYSHRSNADGTVDSICMFCYQTIATAPSERELEAWERTHYCSAKKDAKSSVR